MELEQAKIFFKSIKHIKTIENVSKGGRYCPSCKYYSIINEPSSICLGCFGVNGVPPVWYEQDGNILSKKTKGWCEMPTCGKIIRLETNDTVYILGSTESNTGRIIAEIKNIGNEFPDSISLGYALLDKSGNIIARFENGIYATWFAES